jgi:Holliday junction resolvase RusA-like endonuclease
MALGRLVLKLDITPLGKPRMTQRNKWYAPPEIQRYWNYANELKLKLPHYILGTELTINFYLPMPKSWSKKKRFEMVGQLHDQKPDIDNLAKGFMDAVKSDINDDKRIAVLYCKKYWAEKGAIELPNYAIPKQKEPSNLPF